MSELLQKAISVVEKARAEVNAMLKESNFQHTLLNINSNFDLILTRFKHMGGTLRSDSLSNSSTMKMEPITNFMGTPIVLTPKVTAEDLLPKEEQKNKYIASVDKLYEELPDMSPATVLKSYTTSTDINVLRGVAKRAKVKDFKTRKLDVSFIEEIKLGIEIRNEELEAQQVIDDELLKNGPTVLTETDIKNNPKLRTMKAVAGQQLTVDKDGKYSLKDIDGK